MTSRQNQLKYSITSLLVIVQLCNAQRKVLEDDNIAVPQHDVAVFALPAPGIRFGAQLKQSQASRYASPSNDINNFVGNLLPLDAGQAMPTISTLDVACLPDYMQVRLTFDRPFNGIIYSKGFYDNRDCTYFTPDGRSSSEISFRVGGQGCGTQYIEPPGQPSYMENVIIIQNEPGIQEVWDTARGLRCLFHGGGGVGRSRQTVSAAINVAMLDHQVASFSADTKASASMDIQVGRGPYAPSASGLVKIGEMMTMVVTAEGPSQVDLLVRQCVAHDGTTANSIELTDENGCVLKKKIIGSWQKKRMDDKEGAPIAAYAHFQAFKFPDKMDVYLECEVDLCNGQCIACSEDQTVYSNRKRRAVLLEEESSIPDFEDTIDRAELLLDQLHDKLPNAIRSSENKTENTNLKLAKRLRVLSPDDITVNGDDFSSITLVTRTSTEESGDVCLSLVSFVSGIVAMLIMLVISSGITALLCVRVRTIPSTASSFPPDSSFHAFSTVSGKTT